MADIAAAVGVSRQTVYNEFGGKDELARALLVREASRFLAQVEAALEDHPQTPLAVWAPRSRFSCESRRPNRCCAPSSAARTASAATMTSARCSPHRAPPSCAFVTERLTEHFLAGWPEADRVQVSAYADAAVRLAISHVALPTAEPQVTAAQVTRVFAPYRLQVTRTR